MKLNGEADQSLFTVKDSSNNAADLKETVFPILLNHPDGTAQMLGTGFFITRLGFFMTAKHVLEEVLNQMGEPICNTSLSIIQFKGNNTYYYRPIRGFTRHPEADIAIGECYPMSHKKTGEPLFNRVVPLSLTYPFIGEHIYTYAYPGTTVRQELATNHVSFNVKFYAGILNEYYPKGRDRVMLPFPCYRTSIVLHGGASGGPVFGQNGKVFGVNSTGFDGEICVSYVSRIHDSLGLHIPNVLMPNETEPRTITLQDLIKINHIAI